MNINRNNNLLMIQLNIYINTYKKHYLKMNKVDNKMFNMFILNLQNKYKIF